MTNFYRKINPRNSCFYNRLSTSQWTSKSFRYHKRKKKKKLCYDENNICIYLIVYYLLI